jgi:serine/threonine protein kinase
MTQALGMTILEMATGTPAPAEGQAYHNLREGLAPMPAHITPELQELLKALLHVEAAQRPSAREIVRHPLLSGLMRDESIACLRSEPLPPPPPQSPLHGNQLTSASLMELNVPPQLVASVQSRALKAEKEAARLRAAVQTAQQEAALLRERVKMLEQAAAQDGKLLGSSAFCAASPHAPGFGGTSAQTNSLFQPNSLFQANASGLEPSMAGMPATPADFRGSSDRFAVPSARKEARSKER